MTGFDASMDALVDGLTTMQERVAGADGAALAELGPADGPLAELIRGTAGGVVAVLALLRDGIAAAHPILLQLDGTAALVQTAGAAVDGFGDGLTNTLDDVLAQLQADVGTRRSLRTIGEAVSSFGDGLEDVGDTLGMLGDPGRFAAVVELCNELVGPEDGSSAGSFGGIVEDLTP